MKTKESVSQSINKRELSVGSVPGTVPGRRQLELTQQPGIPRVSLSGSRASLKSFRGTFRRGLRAPGSWGRPGLELRCGPPGWGVTQVPPNQASPLPGFGLFKNKLVTEQAAFPKIK